MRERLDVLHERRSAADAALERPRRRERRLRRAAVQEADERGLLTGDERASGQRRGPAPRDGRRGVSRRASIASASAPQLQLGATRGRRSPARTERVGREHGAVENEVRRRTEEHPVLAARRLALRRVDDDDRPAAARRRPPPASRPVGKPPPPRPRRPLALDQVDQFRPGVRRGSVRGEVVFERGCRPSGADACEQPREPGGGAAHERSRDRAAHCAAPSSRREPRSSRRPCPRRRRARSFMTSRSVVPDGDGDVRVDPAPFRPTIVAAIDDAARLVRERDGAARVIRRPPPSSGVPQTVEAHHAAARGRRTAAAIAIVDVADLVRPGGRHPADQVPAEVARERRATDALARRRVAAVARRSAAASRASRPWPPSRASSGPVRYQAPSTIGSASRGGRPRRAEARAARRGTRRTAIGDHDERERSDREREPSSRSARRVPVPSPWTSASGQSRTRASAAPARCGSRCASAAGS